VTLIVSVLTDEYVALVSDRRVTWRDGGEILSQKDTDNKTICLAGLFLMGFTGLARIDGFRIERWVSDVLKGVQPSAYFMTITQKIGEAFQRMGAAGKEPHAFLAVGFSRLSPDGRIEPLSVTISNSLDANGRFSASAVGPEFAMHVEPLGNRRQVVRSAGWRMRDATGLALAHRIRAVSKGDAFNPALAIGPLLMALRDTARISNGHVGYEALFASLPRCAVGKFGVAAGTVDYRRQPASLYVPENATKPGETVIHMPAIINPGMHTLGIKVYSGSGPIDKLTWPEGY
jgi:FAD/FMN-containing dehydrogenase